MPFLQRHTIRTEHNVYKMANSKTYLNVPFAQKDAAKALGAKWDAINKQWYVPPDKDIALFSQWQVQSAPSVSSSTTAPKPRPTASSGKTASSAKNSTSGVITKAADKNFVAYNGDAPPWD